METGFERLRGELRSELAGLRAEMTKWSFLFWLGMVVSLFISRAI